MVAGREQAGGVFVTQAPRCSVTSTRTLLAVCAAILIAVMFQMLSGPEAAPSVSPALPPKAVAPDPNEVRRLQMERHLTVCDRQVAALIDQQLQDVRRHFAAARQRVPQFSAAALGFRSKWILLADWMPGVTVSHQDYLKQLFASQVLSGETLEQLIRHVVRTTVTEIEELEAQLFVAVAADVEDPPIPTASTFKPERLPLAQLTSRLRNQVTADLRADMGRELASYAAGEVVTAGMGRLGVSAGLLGAGAGSSWTTFGVGLAVGLILDEIVSRIWEWWADPVGQLTATVNAELKQVELDVIEGRVGRQGLRQMLEELGRQRSAQRRRVLLEWLNAEGH